MKIAKIFRHAPHNKVVSIARDLSGRIPGMLILSAILLGGTVISFGAAGDAQEKTVAGGQEAPHYVAVEEENAYRAAKMETDPRKRAEKLFEFAQKYPKSPLLEQKDWEEIKPINDEYNAYYAATQEPDFEKRAVMELSFLQKFPKSSLVPNIDNAYLKTLGELSQEGKYELLESLADKWLKTHPNDRQVYAYLVNASMNLKQYRKAGEFLEDIYKMEPSPGLAREILSAYQKADSLDKQVEWGDKLFKMPEFAGDYMLRYSFVVQFLNAKNIDKAAEYAQLTLSSAEKANPKDAKEREQLQKIRRACHHVIGTALFEKGNYADAITAFQAAVNDERYAQGYYKIAQCLEKEKDIEKATQYYAMAELTGGEDADKAKARLETLYKALHNDTLIGIDKVYKKATESLAGPEGKS